MKQINLSNMSAHAIVDREVRIGIIEKTVGWGFPVAEVPDKANENCTATLTSTGVMIIMNDDEMIVTAWIATIRQAIAVWRQGTGHKEMPNTLWNIVNYNNNTELWQRKTAA